MAAKAVKGIREAIRGEIKRLAWDGAAGHLELFMENSIISPYLAAHPGLHELLTQTPARITVRTPTSTDPIPFGIDALERLILKEKADSERSGNGAKTKSENIEDLAFSKLERLADPKDQLPRNAAKVLMAEYGYGKTSSHKWIARWNDPERRRLWRERCPPPRKSSRP